MLSAPSAHRSGGSSSSLIFRCQGPHHRAVHHTLRAGIIHGRAGVEGFPGCQAPEKPGSLTIVGTWMPLTVLEVTFGTVFLI